MTSAQTSIEHSFRHDYGRLVSILTKRFGVQQIDAIEDAVQGAMERALSTWGRQGIPAQSAAWLLRVAQNILIDRLRREQRERNRAAHLATQIESETHGDARLHDLPRELDDAALRLLFLCCHPELPLEVRVAFALKVVSGFSTRELAASFLITPASVEKRIARAKDKLRSAGVELSDLDPTSLESRLEAVQSTLYLLFNEGYCSSQGDRDLRADLCDEAIRLMRLLANSAETALPSTHALLALMLMHRARMHARQNEDGSIVTLENQDRSRWDWQQVREAMEWMQRSATGDALSRYHLESAIAWEHTRAASLDAVDWISIAGLYRHLEDLAPTPMVRLNAAIAIAYAHGPERGLAELTAIEATDRARIRPWWDCAMAQTYQRLGNTVAALAHWIDAKALAGNTAQRDLIDRRIEACRET
ncbi:MAG: RNA polymerase sigma factor [Pirellula sp.]